MGPGRLRSMHGSRATEVYAWVDGSTSLRSAVLSAQPRDGDGLGCMSRRSRAVQRTEGAHAQVSHHGARGRDRGLDLARDLVSIGVHRELIGSVRRGAGRGW